MVIALVVIAVSYFLAIVTRAAISRRREFMADAGAVDLTKNPDAMISALRKISGHAEIETPDEMAAMLFENREKGLARLMATHPPIEKRIEALVRFAGGRDALDTDGLEFSAGSQAAAAAFPTNT
jgi:heat shock protein HtpX